MALYKYVVELVALNRNGIANLVKLAIPFLFYFLFIIFLYMYYILY